MSFRFFFSHWRWPSRGGRGRKLAAIPRPGHSSSVVWGDGILLTAFEPETSTLRRLAGTEGRLSVLGLNRTWGGTCG